MDISNKSDGCFFRGKADICEELNSRERSSHGRKEHSPANNSLIGASQMEPTRRVDENDTISTEEMAPRQTTSFAVSAEDYRTLLDNLYTARLCFLRATNITTNQLHVCEEEDIEQMHEIKRIIRTELGNPDASARSVAQKLVKAGIAVTGNQQALNAIEFGELVKNLNSLLDTLSSDVKEVKSLTEHEYEAGNEETSNTESVSVSEYWSLFTYCVFLVVIFFFHLLFDD